MSSSTGAVTASLYLPAQRGHSGHTAHRTERNKAAYMYHGAKARETARLPLSSASWTSEKNGPFLCSATQSRQQRPPVPWLPAPYTPSSLCTSHPAFQSNTSCYSISDIKPWSSLRNSRCHPAPSCPTHTLEAWWVSQYSGLQKCKTIVRFLWRIYCKNNRAQHQL